MRQPIPVPEQHRALAEHYRRSFGEPAACVRWTLGPVHELPEDHVVLEWKPRVAGGPWTYATAGMSSADARTDPAVEVHLLAPGKDDAHVELLTVLTHFHVTGPGLGMGHSVNFGRPWLPGSACTYGLLSRPYLRGPSSRPSV